MKNLIFLILSLAFISSDAQFKKNAYKDYPFYGNENPLTLRIKLILLQRDDGTGSFDLQNPEQKAVITDYVENAFKNYQNFNQPEDLTGCYTGMDFIKDAKIRFDYEFIEVPNTYAWDYRNSGTDPVKKKVKGFSPSERWYLKRIDDSLKIAHQENPGIHVYFTNNGDNFDQVYADKCKDCDILGKAAGQFPSKNKLNRSSQVHMTDVFIKYLKMRHHVPAEFNKTWEKDVRNWFVRGDAKGFSHELGHVLGLGHGNEYHNANKCKYTIMSQKGSDPRNYLQPTEIRKIHYKLSTTNLMQFVTAESHYGTTQKLYADEVWESPRRFYQNFELAKGVTLIIKDSIILPPNATFRLNKKSKIIFKNEGKIVYPGGKEFRGWNVHKRAKITHEQ